MRHNPNITKAELVILIGVSNTAIDNNIKYYFSEIEPEIIKWNKKVLETAKEIPNKIIFDENELNTQTCLNLINQVKETNDLNLLKKLNIFPVKLVAY